LHKLSHAIKRYIRIGYDIAEGADIVNAAQNLRGTRLANIIPKRNKELKVKSITGISNWFEWQWPTTHDKSGYIEARAMPGFGKWHSFSPSQIAKLSSANFEKPDPVVEKHTEPKNAWTMHLSQKGII
jgi:hypothetical protein